MNYIQKQNQKGLAPVMLLVVAFIILALIALAIYLILNPQSVNRSDQNVEEQQTVQEDLPLTICETGDPEQCNDPVSNEDVDNITNFEDEYL